VKVILQSGTPGILAGGVGYRNDLGLRAFGQIGYTNLWRENHTLALNGNINKRLNPSFCSTQSTVSSSSVSEDDPCFLEYQVQLGYVWPWFLWGPTQLRPRLTAEKTQYLNFDAETVGFASTLERRLMTRYNVVAAMTYSLENTRQFNALAEEDNQSLRIGALIPSLRMDFRDSSLAPSRGLFLSSSFEWASTWLGAQQEPFPVGYTRFLGRADYYVPIGAGATWFMSFRTGFERNLEPPPAESPDDKRYAIPLIKQFALGGAGSLRGFNEQELNLQEFAIAGTASYVNYRTQVDLPFSGAIRFGPFVDAANLLVDRFSLSEDLRVGAGLGFRYQSPVGPVNLDWGFKVNARAGEDPFRFYFSIGVI
jgi:outer membrane protein insertion porin family